MYRALVTLSNHKLTPFILYLILASGIVYSSVATDYKYLSPDAECYLQEAERLSNEQFCLSSTHPFTLWPVGYPYAIALVHVLTGLSVLLSSKLVNVLFLGGIFSLLRWMFAGRALLYMLLLAHVSFIFMLRYSWPEGVFLFFELLLLFITGKVMQRRNYRQKHLFVSVACIVLMVLFRYAGVFVFFWLGLLFLRAWINREKSLFRYSLRVGLWAFVPVAIYLGYTYAVSGLVFGNDRGLDQAGFFQNTVELGKVLLLQTCFIWRVNSVTSFLLTWLVQGILLFGLIRFFRKKATKNIFPAYAVNFDTFSLNSAALVYFLFVVLLRYFIHFDALDYRLLMPALLPFAVAKLNKMQRDSKNDQVLLYSLVALALLSCGLNFLPAFI